MSHKAELRVDYLIRLLPIYLDLDSSTFDRIYYVYTELSALYQSPPLSQQGTALAFIQSALAKLDSMEQQKQDKETYRKDRIRLMIKLADVMVLPPDNDINGALGVLKEAKKKLKRKKEFRELRRQIKSR